QRVCSPCYQLLKARGELSSTREESEGLEGSTSAAKRLTTSNSSVTTTTTSPPRVRLKKKDKGREMSLEEQLEDVDRKLVSSFRAKSGLENLVRFYDGDPEAQARTKAEMKETEMVIERLQAQKK